MNRIIQTIILALLVLIYTGISNSTIIGSKLQAKASTSIVKLSTSIWEVENDVLDCIVVETYYGVSAGAAGLFPAVSCVRK